MSELDQLLKMSKTVRTPPQKRKEIDSTLTTEKDPSDDRDVLSKPEALASAESNPGNLDSANVLPDKDSQIEDFEKSVQDTTYTLRKSHDARTEIKRVVQELSENLGDKSIIKGLDDFREYNQKFLSRKRRDFNHSLHNLELQLKVPQKADQTVRDLFQTLMQKFSDLKTAREKSEDFLNADVLEIVNKLEGDYILEITRLVTAAKAKTEIYFSHLAPPRPPRKHIEGYDANGKLIINSGFVNTTTPHSPSVQSVACGGFTTPSVLQNPYQFASHLPSNTNSLIGSSTLAQQEVLQPLIPQTSDFLPVSNHIYANSGQENINFDQNLAKLEQSNNINSQNSPTKSGKGKNNAKSRENSSTNGRDKYRDKKEISSSSSSSSSSSNSESSTSSDSSDDSSESSNSSSSNESSQSRAKKKKRKKKKKKRKNDNFDTLTDAMLHSHKLSFDISKHMNKKFVGGEDGPLEYPGWLETWKANLVKMKSLKFSRIDLFWALKKCLGGEAHDMISDIIHPTEKSYKECLALLEKHYGRKDIQIANVIDKLIALPTYSDNLEGVKSGLKETKKLVRQLEKMKLDSEQQKFCLIVGILKNKIPSGVLEKFNRKKLARQSKKHPLGSKVSLKTFWKSWEETEYMYSNRKKEKSAKDDKKSDNRQKSGGATGSSGGSYIKFRHTGGTTTANDEKNTAANGTDSGCIFGCKSGHKAGQLACPKLRQNLTEKSIVEILKEKKACYHCFGVGCRDWKACKEKTAVCDRCNVGKHVPFLCRFADKSSGSHVNQDASNQKDSKSDDEKGDDKKSSKKDKKSKK